MKALSKASGFKTISQFQKAESIDRSFLNAVSEQKKAYELVSARR